MERQARNKIMETFTDYYSLLGIDAHASSDTIKAAFKKLALKYHPDVYKGDDAQERMRLLLLAYQTLSDSDERRIYDVQRAEHLGGGLNGTSASPQHSSTSGAASTARGSDRRFVFPKLDGSIATSVAFELDGFSYTLWPDDASMLRREGMLRGVASESAHRTTTNVEHYCHRCHHRWTLSSQAQQDTVCPACRARDWTEYLLLSCIHCHAVFESQEIRDKIHGSRLYFPYELFPLCPNCRRSQWCPAENERVNVLRAAEARRRALLLLGAFLVVAFVAGILLYVVVR